MKRRAEIVAIIKNVFDVQHNKTGAAVLLFVFSTAAFGWAVTALHPLVVALGKLLLLRPGVVSTLPGLLQDLVGPLLLVALAGVLMARNYRKNRQVTPSYTLAPPEAHEGLIVMLSRYAPRGDAPGKAAVPQTFQALGQALTARHPDARAALRSQVLQSTWGPLWVAVEHHAPRLKHCWLVTTPGERGTARAAATARKLVRRAAAPTGTAEADVACHEVTLDDPHDVSRIVPRLEEAYRQAATAFNLLDDALIADFTGGTAAMSTAMILATLDRARKIEYLRQDVCLWTPEGEGKSAPRLHEEGALVEVQTSHALVLPALAPPPPEEDA